MCVHVCVLVCVAPPMVVGAWLMAGALFEYYYYVTRVLSLVFPTLNCSLPVLACLYKEYTTKRPKKIRNVARASNIIIKTVWVNGTNLFYPKFVSFKYTCTCSLEAILTLSSAITIISSASVYHS